MEDEFKEQNEGILPSSDALEGSEEGLEIDPAEFFDPEEFGLKRAAAPRGPWGCVWCKIPLLTRQSMLEHHARHCSEEIEQGNKRWNAKHGYDS